MHHLIIQVCCLSHKLRIIKVYMLQGTMVGEPTWFPSSISVLSFWTDDRDPRSGML